MEENENTYIYSENEDSGVSSESGFSGLTEENASVLPEENLRERRYLWTARAFAIVFVFSACSTFILLFSLFSLVPLVRVQPFYLTFQNKSEQIVNIMKSYCCVCFGSGCYCVNWISEALKTNSSLTELYLEEIMIIINAL